MDSQVALSGYSIDSIMVFRGCMVYVSLYAKKMLPQTFIRYRRSNCRHKTQASAQMNGADDE